MEKIGKMSTQFEQNELVTLVTIEGTEYEVPLNKATKSLTIKNLIDDSGTDNPIPLVNITEKIFNKILEYLNSETTENDTLEDNGWLKEYFEMEQSDLFELILAANYLDIADLLDFCCKSVANMIKGKAAPEIREMFGIENDFTPEEEEQIRKENEWLTVKA